ncbi:MAG: FAD-dependent oxidoreductase [Candidatus Binatia bacterium]
MAKEKAAGNGRYPHLLSPGRIGSLTLRNRILMCPMGDNLANEDGTVDEREIAYFEARARGGVGLILVGSVPVMWPAGGYNPRHPAVSDDRFIPGLAELARRVHAHDGRIALQLVHGGKSSMQDIAAKRPVMLPSLPTEQAAPDPLGAMNTGEELAAMSEPFIAAGGQVNLHEMTREEIAAVVTAFADAADRAKRAGIDGVEVHGAHGYLLDNFLSPGTNHRTDEYGGPLENRARFLLETLRAIRARVGPAYPMWVRINGTEFFMNGNTVEEAKRVASWVESAGADAVHVSAHGDANRLIIWTETVPQVPGYLVPYAAAVKRQVKITVVAVGRIDPEMAEDIIARGDADFVAMGRKLLADPDLPSKLAHGHPEDVRPCIYQYRCIEQIFLRRPVRCSSNPATAYEHEFELKPAAVPRKVLVAGGGPAGMEAARTAALRGHKVTLCEASTQLGGTTLFSSLVNEANGKLVEYFEAQLKKLPVDVRLGQPVTPDLVRQLGPDVVVVACGARHDTRGLSGADRPNVFDGHDLRALITGQDPALAAAKLSLPQRALLQVGRLVGAAGSMDRLRDLTQRWMRRRCWRSLAAAWSASNWRIPIARGRRSPSSTERRSRQGDGDATALARGPCPARARR